MEATTFVGVGRAQENDVCGNRRVGPRRRGALPGRDPEHAGGPASARGAAEGLPVGSAASAPKTSGLVAERVTAIPSKRVSPPCTQFLQRDEIEAVFASLPQEGHSALRDRALLLFLYNTGARVQEAADLTAGNLVLEPQPRVH